MAVVDANRLASGTLILLNEILFLPCLSVLPAVTFAYLEKKKKNFNPSPDNSLPQLPLPCGILLHALLYLQDNSPWISLPMEHFEVLCVVAVQKQVDGVLSELSLSLLSNYLVCLYFPKPKAPFFIFVTHSSHCSETVFCFFLQNKWRRKLFFDWDFD